MPGKDGAQKNKFSKIVVNWSSARAMQNTCIEEI